ncbi:hypothetical protein J5X84_33025 [Streptosporangiaceae bacterium NEAU-GS5]|nr:hypothetical protein [Streptosporangiaceae bacterium NEAU-GS5]
MHPNAHRPDAACKGACTYPTLRALSEYLYALDDHEAALHTHAAALDAWTTAGAEGTPPEPPTPPEQPRLRWRVGEPYFCQRDIAATRRSLLELDPQAAILDAGSDGHRGRSTSDGKVSGSKTTM